MTHFLLTYRKDIDGLRALAVTPIVLGHAGITGFSGGFVGVDIFFVISGFLIAGILQRELRDEKFSIIGFYERRIRRILPALFVLLAVCFGVAIRFFPPDMFVNLSHSTIATLLFVSNIWFFHNSSDYFAPDADLNPLLHTWSLGVEEQFYIIFPLIFWWLWSRPKTFRAGVIAGICLVSFGLSVWTVRAYPLADFYLLPMRAWELGLGILLAMGIVPNAESKARAEITSVLGLICIIYSVIFFDDATPFPGAAAALPCFGTAMLIWAGTGRDTFISRILSTPVLVGIGLISYSLYLWHWPIIVFSKLRLGTPVLSTFSAMIAIALSLIFAGLSWRFVEQPFRRRESKRVSRRSIFIGATSLTLILIAGAGLVQREEGFPQRVPEDVRMIYAAVNDMNPDRPRCINKRPSQGLCDIVPGLSETGKREVLLWGDSHAGAVMPGLAEILSEQGMNGFIAFKGGCPPILGLERADKGKQRKQCPEHNEQVMEMLRTRTDMGIVILVARWSIAAEGTRVIGEAKKPAIFRPEGYSGLDFNPASNYAFFEQTMVETIHAIRKTGRQVIIVEGFPEFGRSIPLILGNSRFFGAKPPAALKLQSAQRRNERANRILHYVDAEDDGVWFAQTLSVVCQPVCLISVEDRPLYRDDDHLSLYGSKYLIPIILTETLTDVRKAAEALKEKTP